MKRIYYAMKIKWLSRQLRHLQSELDNAAIPTEAEISELSQELQTESDMWNMSVSTGPAPPSNYSEIERKLQNKIYLRELPDKIAELKSKIFQLQNKCEKSQ